MANEHIDVLNAILDFAGDRFETPAEKRKEEQWNKQFIATLSQADTVAAAKIKAATKIADAEKRSENIAYYGKTTVGPDDRTFAYKKQERELLMDHIITDRDVAQDSSLIKGRIMSYADYVAYTARRDEMLPLGKENSKQIYDNESKANLKVDLQTFLMIDKNRMEGRGVDKDLVLKYLGQDIYDEWEKEVHGPNKDRPKWEFVNTKEFSIMIAAATSGMGIDAAMDQLHREDKLVAQSLPLLSEVDVSSYESSGWLNPFNEEDIFANIEGGKGSKLMPYHHNLTNITRDVDKYALLYKTVDKAGNRIGDVKASSVLRQLRHYMDLLGEDPRFWNAEGNVFTDEFRNAKAIYIQSQMVYKQITGKNYKPKDTSKYEAWIQIDYFGGMKTKTPVNPAVVQPAGAGAGNVWLPSPSRPKYKKIEGHNHYHKAKRQAKNSGVDIEIILQGQPYNYTAEQAAYIVVLKS